MRVLLRIVCAAVIAVVGWAGELGIYVALTGISGDVRFWGVATGIYWFAALLLVGLPVTLMNPVAYLGRRRWKAVGLVALAGGLLAAVPPSGGMYPITVPLGVLGGAFGMLAYTSILDLFPRPFGAPDSNP